MSVAGLAPLNARSLRWRLLRWVTLTTIVIWGLAAGLSYHQARAEVQELMDGQMAKMARLLLAQIHEDTSYLKDLPENMNSLRGTKSRRSELALEFQIGYPDGTVLVNSAMAPETPLTRPLGYANVEHAGHPWRSLILETADGRYRAQVAHSFHTRDKEALEIASKTVLPLGLLLPLMVALLYFSIQRCLKPLDDLAEDVASRSPDNLTTLQPETTLLETQPQVAMATKNPEERDHAMAQVLAGVDRTTRLVEQLLRLARLDPIVQLSDTQPIDLLELARGALESAHSAAATRRQRLHLTAPMDAPRITGDPDLLGAALRNLLDNAVRYGPEQSTVTLTIDNDPGGLRLEVSDEGPGTPEEDLSHLTNRFFRSSEAGSEGSGLGLSIVQRIAELHGARLELENRQGGGFVARLRWPIDGKTGGLATTSGWKI